MYVRVAAEMIIMNRCLHVHAAAEIIIMGNWAAHMPHLLVTFLSLGNWEVARATNVR